jgi:hypothetical protein
VSEARVSSVDESLRADVFPRIWSALLREPKTVDVLGTDQAGTLAKALTDDIKGCSMPEQFR